MPGLTRHLPMRPRRFHTYIMSNQWDTVLYVGISGNLEGRVRQHKEGKHEGFTKRYHVNKLVYYEEYKSPMEAIRREKQIKKYRREKKDALVASMNPKWEDLAKDWR